MRIKQIEIDNFKSFRSKTTIPFMDGFTTISGPNGSGKSNIIDCILFALGLSSSRTLRAEKLTDLINNNNQRREASVTITFSDEKDQEKEFEIRRKIKEGLNGYTSTYYLNNHVSTLSEIHKTLSDYNISPGCYNVMMQGDVTGIINMSNVERRKIIDEIAGVAEFDRRIEQAHAELDTVDDRIERSQIIMGEIDLRLEQLARERELALKYQKLKNDKQQAINQISLVKYADLKRAQGLLHENITESNKEKSKLQNDIAEFEDNISQARILLDELNEKVKIKGEDEQISLTKQAETLRGEIYRKEQGIEFKNNKINENKVTSSKSQREMTSLTEALDDLQLKVENKQEQYKVIENQIQKENDNLKNLIEESCDLSKTAQSFIQKRNLLRKELELSEDEQGRLTREKLKWEDVIKRLGSELEEIETQLYTSDEDKQSLVNRKEELIKQLSDLEQEESACKKQLEYAISRIKDKKAEISEIEDKTYKYSRQLMQLEANKKAAEEVHFGRAVDTVLNSGISGVHKTLAQLGRVPEEYSTALEIAMGGRMQCIVVDNENVASQAINLVKQQRAGRITCLPLNKMKYYVPRAGLPNRPGVIGFAINLIDFDNIYKNVFFYALGETLIVEDVESAKPLMGEYRMVTLDGTLIEKAGAMTGGSVSKSSLKFSNSYNTEISELKTIIKDLESQKYELQEELSNLENKMERHRKDYSNCLTQMHQKKLELENITKTLNSLDEQLNGKSRHVDEINSRLSEADIEKSSVEDELLDVNNKVKSIKDQINETDSNIPAEKLEQIEKLTGELEFEIKNWEAKLRNIETEIKKLSMEKEFKEQSMEYQKEKIEQCKEENARLEQEINDAKSEICIIEAKVQELNDKISSLSIELKELQKERDNALKNLYEMQETKEKALHNIQRIEETLVAYTERKKEVTSQLASLREELRAQEIDFTKADEVKTTAEELNRSIDRLTRRMEELEPVNMLAIKEYDEVQDRKDELDVRMTTLIKEKDEINTRLNSYENLKKESFITTFDNVNRNFQEIFETLSDGEGHLALENKDDIFKGGLIIEARPRGKKLLRLEAMSGGEKSLTALAFVFAFQRYMPAPFYAFDEVDMFLDGINVEKLAQMIRSQASNAQFIVVSLRKPMIEKADRTVGVTQRNDGITKVTGVVLHE